METGRFWRAGRVIASSLPRGKITERERVRGLRDDGDGEAGPGEGEEGAGVPVGEAEAAVGFGAA